MASMGLADGDQAADKLDADGCIRGKPQKTKDVYKAQRGFLWRSLKKHEKSLLNMALQRTSCV